MVGKHLSHYRIESELGRGGMGIVYRAADTKLDRTVAIKVLPAAALANADDRARFYREAKASAQLHHPHIASVFEIDEAVPEGARDEELRPFIAMEFIDGEALSSVIESGPMDLKKAVRIAREIASALEAAHKKGIVHRDIKSQNVMLTTDGVAKVLDFGLAQTSQSTKLTRMGTTVGTVAYMSPEQARGEEVDARTDLWSLGVILYELVSGRSPFPGTYEQAVVYEILNQDPEALTALRTGVPMELERIVNKCMAKEERSRYQSATDLIVDLENIDIVSGRLSTTSRTTSKATPSAAVAGSKQSSPSLLHIGVSVVATALLVSLSFWGFGNHETVQDSQLRKLELRIPGVQDGYFPQMNAEESLIYFGGIDTSGVIGIFQLDLETGEQSLIVSHAWWPVLSPDGTRLAYVFLGEDGDERRSEFILLPNGRPQTIPDSLDSMFWLDDNTVGGRARGHRHSFTFDITSSTKQPFVDIRGDERGGGLYFSDVSHENGLLLYNHEFLDGSPPIMYVYESRSGESHVIAEGGMNGVFVGANYVAYQFEDGGELLLQSVNLQAVESLGRPVDVLPQADWVRYQTTADGDLLYFDVSEAKQVLKTYSLEGELLDSRVLPEFSNAWSSNRAGSHLVGTVHLSGSSITRSIVIMNARTGELETVVDARPGIENPRWSADESRIEFITPGVEVAQFFSVQVNGIGNETEIERHFHKKYSPDRRRSYYIVPSQGLDSAIVRIRNEVSMQERTIDSGLSTASFSGGYFSPDGRYFTFGMDDRRWVINFDTLDRYEVPSELDRWGPSGDYLYGHQDGQVIRAPYTYEGGFTVTGPIESVFTIDGTASELVAVLPDRFLTIGADYVDDYSVLHWWQNYAASLESE